MTEARRRELEAVFRYCVRVPEGTPVAEVTRAGWGAWDSMAHVALIGAIEDQFDLPIGLDDAQQVADWAGCLRLVAAKDEARGQG